MATVTPKELYDKYKSKKYKAANAGFCIVLEYIYQTLLLRYGAEDLPKTLYSPERYLSIIKKGTTSEIARDRWLVSGTQSLVEWLPTIWESAITAREAANMAIVNALSHVNTIAFLSKKTFLYFDRTDPEITRTQRHKTAVMKALHEHENDVRQLYKSTRDYIINILCYVNSFNVFIDCLADEMSIPETRIFAIDTSTTADFLDSLNGALKSMSPLKEQMEYDELLDTNPIQLVPVPVPETNRKRSANTITQALYSGKAWSVAFSEMTSGYWRRLIND